MREIKIHSIHKHTKEILNDSEFYSTFFGANDSPMKNKANAIKQSKVSKMLVDHSLKSPINQYEQGETDDDGIKDRTFNLNHQNIDYKELIDVIKDKQSKGIEDQILQLSHDSLQINKDDPNYVFEEYQKQVLQKEINDRETFQLFQMQSNICNKKVPQFRSFDNRIKENLKDIESELYPTKFNFDSYEFNNNVESEYRLKQYQRQFTIAKNNSENKKEIYHKMVELIYENVSSSLDEQKIPDTFRGNRQAWFKQLLKSQKLQTFYQEFKDQLSKIIQSEINDNQANFDLYMTHPRPKRNICNLYANGTFVEKKVKDKEENMISKGIKQAKDKFKVKQIQEQTQSQDKKAQKLNSNKKDEEDSKKKYYSGFQIKLKERTEQIDELIKSIDQNNEDWRDDIAEIENDLETLNLEKKRDMLPVIPGEHIMNMLLKWDAINKESYTAEQTDRFINEFALSLRQFEKQLRSESKGHEMELAYRMKLAYNIQRDTVQKTSFLLEAQGIAMNDMKIKMKREYEQINMQFADLESKLLKQDMPDSDVNDIVSECEGPLFLKNTAQAREYIHRLCTIVRAQQKNVSLQRSSLKTMTASIGINEVDIQNLKKSFETTVEHRLFYQHKLVKLVRDLDLFNYDNIKKKEFESIYEYSENLEDQIMFKELIEKIDLKKELINHANRNMGTKQQIGELYQNLQSLGIFRDYDAILDGDQSAANTPRGKKKNGKFKNKTKIDQQQKQIKIMIDNGAKDKIKEQIQKALDGHIETPFATEESGQPVISLPEFIEQEKQRILQQSIQQKNERKGKLMSKSKLKNFSKRSLIEKSSNKKQSNVNSLPKIKEEIIKTDNNNQSQTFDSKSNKNLPISKPETAQTIKEVKSNLSVSLDSIKSVEKLENPKIGSKSPYSSPYPSQNQINFNTDLIQIQKQIKRTESKSVNSEKSWNEKKNPQIIIGGESTLKSLSLADSDDKQSDQIEEQESEEYSYSQKISDQEMKSLKGDIVDNSIKVTKQASFNLNLQPIQQIKKNSSSSARNVLKQERNKKTVGKVGEMSPFTKKKKENIQPEKNKLIDEIGKFEGQIIQNEFNMLSVVDEIEEIKGILRIDQEMEELQKAKYDDLKKQVGEEATANQKAFHLNAKLIQEMQQMLESSINTHFGFDECQEIIESADVEKFMNLFNTFNEDKFGFGPTNDFIYNQGPPLLQDDDVIEEQQPSPISNISKRKKKKKSKEIKQVATGDIIKPIINENGQFLGVQVRPDLAKPMLLSYNNDPSILKKIMKICAFINRMMRDVHKDDFALIQIKDLEVQKKQKEFTDFECQVVEEELEKTFDQLLTKQSEENVFRILKQHAIDVMVRSVPHKRGYFNMVWENFTLNELLNYQMNNVFSNSNQEDEDQGGKGIQFIEYLNTVLGSIKIKFMKVKIEKEKMERIVVQNFILSGLNQTKGASDGLVLTYDKGIQNVVATRNQDDQTMDELMPYRIKEVALDLTTIPDPGRQIDETKPLGSQSRKVAKNQLILDLALESEFNETMEIFDIFVNMIGEKRLNHLKEQKESQIRPIKVQEEQNDDQIQIYERKTQMQEALRTSIDLNMSQFKEKLSDVVGEIKELDNQQLKKKMKIQLFQNLKPDREGWSDENLIEQQQLEANENTIQVQNMDQDTKKQTFPKMGVTQNSCFLDQSSKSTIADNVIFIKSDHEVQPKEQKKVKGKLLKSQLASNIHTNSDFSEKIDFSERIKNIKFNNLNKEQQNNLLSHQQFQNLVKSPIKRKDIKFKTSKHKDQQAIFGMNIFPNSMMNSPIQSRDVSMDQLRNNDSYALMNRTFQTQSSHVKFPNVSQSLNVSRNNLQGETLTQFIDRASKSPDLGFLPNQIAQTVYKQSNFQFNSPNLENKWETFNKNRSNQTYSVNNQSIQQLYYEKNKKESTKQDLFIHLEFAKKKQQFETLNRTNQSNLSKLSYDHKQINNRESRKIYNPRTFKLPPKLGERQESIQYLQYPSPIHVMSKQRSLKQKLIQNGLAKQSNERMNTETFDNNEFTTFNGQSTNQDSFRQIQGSSTQNIIISTYQNSPQKLKNNPQNQINKGTGIKYLKNEKQMGYDEQPGQLAPFQGRSYSREASNFLLEVSPDLKKEEI